MTSRTATILWFSGLCFGLGASLGQAQTERAFNPRRVIPGPLPAITNAPFVPMAEATADVVKGSELVLGVELNGQARAYPINQLTGPRREIINDELGGRAIAATW